MMSEARMVKLKMKLRVLKTELVLRKKYANQSALARDRLVKQIIKLEKQIERGT